MIQALVTYFVIVLISSKNDIYQFEIVNSIFIVLILFIFNLLIFVLTYSYDRDKYLKNFMIIQTLLFTIMILCEISGTFIHPYISPYFIVGLSTASLISKKLGLFVNCAVGFIALFIGIFTSGFTTALFIRAVLSLLGGTFLILLASQTDSRIKTFGNAFIAIPVFCAIFGMFIYVFAVQEIELLVAFIVIALSPIFGVFVTIGTLPFYEWGFKLVTPYRITELSDASKGLLKELSEKAPGTFNHSLSVANIAAAAAASIGEDASLARACAMFHDVGKMLEPSIFIENQNEETGNPHDKLTPELSVGLIKKHTKDGEELLAKKRYPNIIVSASAEHHGTLPIAFFYAKAQKFSAREVDIADYSYEGRKPQSKITAIIMISDASEAAVRSNGTLDFESVDIIVKKIIEERLLFEQFDECGMTFKELRIVRKSIVDSFAGIMHKRIKYPKFEISRLEKL